MKKRPSIASDEALTLFLQLTFDPKRYSQSESCNFVCSICSQMSRTGIVSQAFLIRLEALLRYEVVAYVLPNKLHP